MVTEAYLSSPEKHFGRSKRFLASLEEKNGYVKADKVISEDIIEEAKMLATCAYEDGTHWGQEASHNLFTFHICCLRVCLD